MVYKKVYSIKGIYYNGTPIYFIEDTKNALYRFDFSESYLMLFFLLHVSERNRLSATH